MKRLATVPNLMFLALIVLELFPSRRLVKNAGGIYWFFIALVVLVELFYLAKLTLGKDSQKAETTGDVTGIVYAFLFVWELATTKLNLLDRMLYPTPAEVISLFVYEIPDMLKGLASSMLLLTAGFLLALITAVPLAIVVGWRKRLHRAAKPLTKVLGPIPPIVYIPYAIGIMPTFRMASIFIIFIGAFWPIFINTLSGVFNIEKKLIDSAKVLNVGERAMLLEVILPGTMPAIISGCNIGLVLSFILLTAAEIIGATSGLGWYVKYFSDFADYPRVIVGIVFIGIVVTGITFVFDRIEMHLLRWRN